jgi:hypothetical protein
VPAINHPALPFQLRENRLAKVLVRRFDTARAVENRIKLEVLQMKLVCQRTGKSRLAATWSAYNNESGQLENDLARP